MVDGSGCFMTQRQLPAMALISPRVEVSQLPPGGEGGNREEEGEEVTLHLSAPGMPDLVIKTPPADSPTQQIRYILCVYSTVQLLVCVYSTVQLLVCCV